MTLDIITFGSSVNVGIVMRVKHVLAVIAISPIVHLIITYFNTRV